MKRALWMLALAGLASAGLPAHAQAQSRFWYGGGVGLYLGDVDGVSLEPLVGYRATDELSLGLRLIYRWRHDSRYEPSLDASDYGAGVFARYDLFRGLFLHGEYEHLSYEYRDFDGSEQRDGYDSILGGGGFSRPIGGGSSLYTTVLYNFNYDEADSPYSDPWVVRVGVAFGF
jgi:hypothetical protein